MSPSWGRNNVVLLLDSFGHVELEILQFRVYGGNQPMTRDKGLSGNHNRKEGCVLSFWS